MPPGVYPRKPIDQRFLDKVEKTSTCWLWTASRKVGGYGQFWDGERLVLAHRWAYERFVGPIPEGFQIDHVRERGCQHRHCVNPAHLEAVTCRENLLRGDTRTAAETAQTHCIYGHPFAGENLYIGPDGKRRCRECSRRHDRQRRRATARTASVPLDAAA